MVNIWGVSSKLGYHRLTVYINSANTLQFLSHDQQETMVARVTQTTNTTNTHQGQVWTEIFFISRLSVGCWLSRPWRPQPHLWRMMTAVSCCLTRTLSWLLTSLMISSVRRRLTREGGMGGWLFLKQLRVLLQLERSFLISKLENQLRQGRDRVKPWEEKNQI